MKAKCIKQDPFGEFEVGRVYDYYDRNNGHGVKITGIGNVGYKVFNSHFQQVK